MVGYRGVGVGPPVRTDGRGKGAAKGGKWHSRHDPCFSLAKKQNAA